MLPGKSQKQGTMAAAISHPCFPSCAKTHTTLQDMEGGSAAAEEDEVGRGSNNSPPPLAAMLFRSGSMAGIWLSTGYLKMTYEEKRHSSMVAIHRMYASEGASRAIYSSPTSGLTLRPCQ